MTPNLLTRGLAGALATGFVALVVLLLALSPNEFRAPALHYALIGYLTVRLIAVSFNARAAPSLLVLHWFTLFGATIPLLFQYEGNSFHYRFMSSDTFDIFHPIVIIFLFAVSVDAGHWLGTGRGRAPTPPEPAMGASVGALVLLFLFANALIGGAINHYGLSYFLASRLEQFLDYEAGSLNFFLFNYLMRLALYWTFILGVLIVRDTARSDGWSSLRPMIALLVVLLATAEILLFSNPLGVARFLILGFLLMMVVAFSDFSKGWLRLGFVVGAAAGLYLVFPVLGSAPRAKEIVWVLDSEQLTAYLSHLDFDNGAQLLMGYRYSLAEGLHYGWNTLSALFILVPRSIWPGKSDGLGALVISYFGGTFTNVSAPVYLEFFLDFGYVGVVALSLVLGYILGAINAAATRLGKYSAAWMMNIALFAAMPIVVRGALMTGTSLLYAHAIAVLTFVAARILTTTAPGPATLRTGSR